MKGLMPLFLGVFGTFAFSWIGLTVIPNLQIGAMNPQTNADDENDIYPMPQSGMVQHGRSVYAANGCIYCHSQQVRPDYAASDIERKWGDRRSAPRDYVFDRPVLLGKERMGPDLANIGKRGMPSEESPSPSAAPASPAPSGQAAATAAASPSPSVSAAANENAEPALYSEAWHHKHLYAPRSMNPDTEDSNMPAYKFLYEKRRIGAERSGDALQLTGPDAPPPGWEIVPTYDAKCLVAYLMSQDQSHSLKEVKSAPGAAPAGSPAASPAAAAAAPASPPPKK